MELDLIGWDPATPPRPSPAFGFKYEGAIGQPIRKTTSLRNPLMYMDGFIYFWNETFRRDVLAW